MIIARSDETLQPTLPRLRRSLLDTNKEPDNLAYYSDIPGSRCGPEDGPWPRTYQPLSESEIWRELADLAKPQTRIFDAARGWRADSVNFQPCHSYRTQDRYVVRELDIHGKKWTLTGIFDGHLGDATVEHTAYHLPIIIRDFLRVAAKESASGSLAPEIVSGVLSRSIRSFDDAIASDVLALFPEGLQSLSNLSDEEIRKTLHDHYGGSHNYNKARLCMYGTTALVALVDPGHDNLWVANLGDCQAVLVCPDALGRWKTELLTEVHNGDNPREVERVRREHPGELECVVDGRILGAIAPSRCIGDTPFKQPPEFTRRILYNLYPGYHDTSPWEEFLVRNRSPPYISAEAEVVHRSLNSPSRWSTASDRFLVLCSDGLTDLCNGHVGPLIAEMWQQEFTGKAFATVSGEPNNLALRLIRRAIGANDNRKVSKVLTLDMDIPWTDDTAVVVQSI